MYSLRAIIEVGCLVRSVLEIGNTPSRIRWWQNKPALYSWGQCLREKPFKRCVTINDVQFPPGTVRIATTKGYAGHHRSESAGYKSCI